jgi:hypothetical protein
MLSPETIATHIDQMFEGRQRYLAKSPEQVEHIHSPAAHYR